MAIEIIKLKNMEQVLLPTHSLRISKSGNYLETPGFCGVSQFSARYSMVGGMNAPKKISCIGSDGKVRPQLLKGKDDLRLVFDCEVYFFTSPIIFILYSV